MAKETIAPAGGHLFADKGRARPASGLRAIQPEVEHDEEPEIPAVAAPSPDPLQFAAAEDELAEAASLQAGGFKSAEPDDPAPPTPAAVEPEAGEVTQEIKVSDAAAAGPADIESALAEAAGASVKTPAERTTALLARSSTLHPLVIGAAFVALLLASLGIGYGISLIAGGSSPDAGAPAEATRSTGLAPTPSTD